jgi:tRNA(Ile)-lysidine synthetase-like protein
VAIPELGLALTLARRPVEPWMLAGRPDRAGLALGLEEGQRVEIRNRRPGDRIRPLGAGGSRRLKEVLIDRRVPRARRDRIPLLVVGGAIAWVPGVTIDERFRLDGRDGVRAGATAWCAEIEAL